MSYFFPKAVLRIVLIYALCACLWIISSDWLLGLFFSNPATYLRLSAYKGLAFVLATAALLSWLLRAELKKRDDANIALRESNAEIRRHQALLLSIAEGTSDAVYVKDRQGRYLLINSAACRVLGKSRDEVIGRDDTALFSAEDAQEIMAGDQRIMESGETATYEECFASGGELRTFLSTKGAVLDSQQNVAGLFGIARDITERRCAENAARTEQQRLESIIEFLPDATFVTDKNNRIIAWNRACEILTGVQKEALLGRGDYAYAEPFFGERRPMLIDLLDSPNAEAGARYKYLKWSGNTLLAESFTPYLREGRGAHLWGAAAPLFDKEGMQLGAIEVVRDITELKNVEQTLRESERKYRELVEYANTIILHWTHEGRITFLNEFGQRFFGYSSEEIIGRHVIGTIVPAKDSSGNDLNELIDQICTDPVSFEKNVNENIRRNGERVWIAWTNRIVRDEKGRVSEILSIGTDITELKHSEQAIQELNASLEQRVAERTAELAIAKDRAEAADRLKSVFLATMSHELRTPLNSIIGFTGILLQGLAGAVNPEQRKQLEMVRNSAQHLLALINDVLDISKIEAGQLEITCQPFDLRETFARVASIIQPMIEKKGLALYINIAPGIGAWVSDRRRIEQVLINLLNNAIKFTDRGSITITADNVHPESNALHSKIHISIADTGIGIKPEDMSKLFQPFRQIDSGLSRLHEGTGLGLAISQRLAELLGGKIQASSDWGKGSIFEFTLPQMEQGE